MGRTWRHSSYFRAGEEEVAQKRKREGSRGLGTAEESPHFRPAKEVEENSRAAEGKL